MLEQSEVYEDRVRGESDGAVGRRRSARSSASSRCCSTRAPASSETWFNYHLPDQRDEIPAGMLIPDIPGSLNLRHPEACGALEQAAAQRGRDGVPRDPGRSTSRSAPSRACVGAPAAASTRCGARIIVGADGRRSRVRKALGLELERAPVINHVTGMLLEDLVDVDADHDFLAGEGDLFMATFHQKEGRARVYLFPSVAEPDRYVGAGNVEKFLADCAFECLPFGKRLAAGRPAGPIATYPGDDTWIDRAVRRRRGADRRRRPVTATRSSGRDSRSRCATRARCATCCAATTGAAAAFGDYGEERRERMRRLRFIADTLAITEAEHADNREARRAKWGELLATDPRAFLLNVGALAGPEMVPADSFDDELHAAVRAA